MKNENSIQVVEAGASIRKFGNASLNVTYGVLLPVLGFTIATDGINTLNKTGKLIGPEFDHFFASQVYPLMVEKTPALAREFLNLLESVATDDALLTKTTTLSIALFAGGVTAYLTGLVSWGVGAIQHIHSIKSDQAGE